MRGKNNGLLLRSAPVFVVVCLVAASCARMPTARISTAAAAVQGKIYLIGGLTSKRAVALVEQYDPLEDRWSKKAPMPTERCGGAAVALDEHIYVLGGRSGNDVLATLERYDPASDSWNKCSPMPTARWCLMAAAVGGKIYALGGIAGVGDERRVLDVVEVYDPVKDTWAKLAPMPVGKSAAATAALRNRIYIIGGRLTPGPTPSGTARVDVYDPAEEVWLEVSPLSQGRTASKACVVRNKIYVIGGAARGGATSSTIEVYDYQTDSWITGPELKQPRSSHSCAVVGNSIYVMNGSSSPSISGFLTSVEKITPD